LSGPLRGARVAIVTCGVVVALDQGVKAIVNAQLARGEEVQLLPFLALHNTRNSGIAFGLAGGASPVFIAVSVLAVVGVLGLLLVRAQSPWMWLAAGLLLGGALGNLADRARQGAVTDFIDFPAWPTFNLADVAITAGVVLLLLVHWHGSGDERAGERAP
jgi:signal peptidase II